MKRLKANKTTLYNLVQDLVQDLDWLHIPALRKVTFEKAYRRPNFSLSWRNDDGTHSQAFFCACLGCATLAIELHDTGTLANSSIRKRTWIGSVPPCFWSAQS